MAITLPTAAEFKARYPEFASLSDAQVNAVITGDCAAFVDDTWIAGDITPAILALAAHLLAAGGALSDDQATFSTSGPLVKRRAGDTEEMFAASASDGSASGGSSYESTAYGRLFLMLRAKSVVPVVSV